MSRAFIKEDDSNVSAEELPERPQSPHPNYVTPGGLAALQSQLAELQEQRRQLLEHPDAILAQEHLKPVERDIRYFQERIERAVVIDPASQPRDKVSFGAVVTTVDEDDDGAALRHRRRGRGRSRRRQDQLGLPAGPGPDRGGGRRQRRLEAPRRRQDPRGHGDRLLGRPVQLNP